MHETRLQLFSLFLKEQSNLGYGYEETLYMLEQQKSRLCESAPMLCLHL